MSAVAYTELQSIVIRIVAESGAVDFPTLRDLVRKRLPDVSAYGVRNAVLSLLDRGCLRFGAGGHPMHYTLGDSVEALQLRRCDDALTWQQRLLFTLREAHGDVPGLALLGIYSELRPERLLTLLLEMTDLGLLVRNGRRGAYRYRWISDTPTVKPDAVRRLRAERRAIRQVSSPASAPLPMPSIAPDWPAEPRQSFGTVSLGIACHRPWSRAA